MSEKIKKYIPIIAVAVVVIIAAVVLLAGSGKAKVVGTWVDSFVVEDKSDDEFRRWCADTYYEPTCTVYLKSGTVGSNSKGRFLQSSGTWKKRGNQLFVTVNSLGALVTDQVTIKNGITYDGFGQTQKYKISDRTDLTWDECRELIENLRAEYRK